MRLAEYRYRTISGIAGQLLFVEQVVGARLGESVIIVTPDGETIEGEVLQIDGRQAMVQVYGESRGLDCDETEVIFSDSLKLVPLSPDLAGRRFSGSFRPLDDLPMILPDEWRPLTAAPMNPAVRLPPARFIETGISAIDGLNTLVKGQKLPIFSGAGLPAKELVARILANIQREQEGDRPLVLVLAALGLTFQEYTFYQEALNQTRTEFTAFINLASDPVMERLLAPRFALTVAEYFAFDLDKDVLVLMTDMVNYCDALREVANAREELPGRRGYPGYMYSDLAALYERAGRVRDRPGSITIMPVVTMPEDDITHPIPDLTGYITEGQIVLSRELHQQGYFPPVDILPSLSRLMEKGIGRDRTRPDHRTIANLLYRHYAGGRETRRLESIIGREGMSERDVARLDFAAAFETEFIHQGDSRRTIGETLDTGRRLLQQFGLFPDEKPQTEAEEE